VGDEQKISWQELLANSRKAFDGGTDFTVAVEEEFALLDPETLELTDRFEQIYAAAQETDLAPNIVGELIASEVEVRTGKCTNFAEAAAAMQERRSQLHSVARDLQIGLGGTGTHPWSRWQDQRIIDTPHYRRNDEILRYVVWRNNTFGLHVHVGIAGADRAIKVHDALRTFLPEVLALSASSPFVESVNSGLHSARTEISFLYRTGSVTEHTQIWWSVRPHLAFPTIEIRIADGQPDLAEAQSLAAFAYALAARCARAVDEGETIPNLPHRLLEENLWRATRYGLSGELLDLERAEPVHARRRLEDLLEWVSPVADEIGAAPYLAIPERNAAERQIARFQEGAGLQEIYAEQVQAGEPIGG
jgi:carboxylate-amine ligase